MKDFIKTAVFLILVLALSTFSGFWIVAFFGAGMLFLPLGAVIFAIFPKAMSSSLDFLRAKVTN